MEKEFKELMEKKDLTPRDVSLFLAKYGGSYEGAKLGSQLLDKVNKK